MPSEENQTVLIVGAGPVGLVAANLLVDGGIPVTIVESCEDVPRDLRASTFHPPTLDMLERFGVVPSMIEQGLICPTWQFRDRTEGVVATFELARLSPDTNHPYRLQCEQWRLGELLFARLKASPLATFRLSTTATAARQTANGVELDVKSKDGGVETLTASFLVGADGIGSVVRAAVGAAFDGITIPELFLTLSTTYDFREAMPDIANISYLSDPKEWYVLIRTKRVWRALFPVDAALDDKDVTSPERAERLLQGAVPRSERYEVTHRTAYRVHERVASTYVNGRILIAGDAAHVNNPLGGMGLNGGVHDAFNLAEKLTAVIKGAPLETLERYSRQRRKIALDVVQQTTLRNRAILNTREPEARRAYYDDLRRIAGDPEKHREYVMRTSMIQSLRDSEKIA
ncbi:MAG: FAD-dependent monooxygenase [Pseudolabrys sp.]|jgi:3-(3-hydroxy-phenyl)propionate hydroxylase|nr:FAD-dependent monooxygenase [Pseudolabrys sp.]